MTLGVIANENKIYDENTCLLGTSGSLSVFSLGNDETKVSSQPVQNVLVYNVSVLRSLKCVRI